MTNKTVVRPAYTITHWYIITVLCGGHTNGGGYLSPLQPHIFHLTSRGVHIHTLICAQTEIQVKGHYTGQRTQEAGESPRENPQLLKDRQSAIR